MGDVNLETRRFDDWSKLLNRNTKLPNDSKLKPTVPFSHLKRESSSVRKERKILTSEMWLG